eukprot:TRINITY_DN71157_c0_g1_i1.p2 TRINITY_DN71157_c0_g1~~TRINITY_DN71157_c0_g1_i1.p2  ORF type:complete len:151 (-),score=17.36 TRINITY_DN71157_c0_g1_i1:352-804(-)
MQIEFRPEFGYVLVTAAAGAIVHNLWMSLKVGAARKKYGVKYPNLYANKDNCSSEENIKAFNCVQRGHQNSLEVLPTFYTMLLMSGLKYPVTASVLGATCVIGRIVYFQGYSTGNPNARQRGTFGMMALLGLIGCSLKFAFDLLSSSFSY